MMPRDRVLSSINGVENWPVPFDIMENAIYPVLETGLCRHFGLADSDHEGLLRALGAHTRWGRPAYIGPPLEEAPVQPLSSFPAKKATRSIWGSWSGMNTYSDKFERPLASVETTADVETHAWPDPNWFDYKRIGCIHDDEYVPIHTWAERNSKYARIVGGFDPIFSRIMDLCGMERGLEIMASQPELIEAMTAHIGGFLGDYYRRIAEAGQGHTDFLAFGDDFAGQNGMLVSPERWRQYFLPTWKMLFGIAQDNGMKAVLHSCGSVRPVLGDLIDAGLDVFEVVQVTAEGMDPFELKREFGDHLTFYGGLDTQYILPYGTEEEVQAEVHRIIDALADGGKFILANMHILMEDVPVRNVLAMCEEACTYRPRRG